GWSRSPWLLPDDVARPLVLAQAQKAGMAQSAVTRPLAETDLRDQAGLDPRDVARGRSVARNRGIRPAQGRQPPCQLVERRAVEAGADAARVAEVAAVVVPEQQRAELLARPLRGGVPDDDQLLLIAALELEPVARAPADVRAVH